MGARCRLGSTKTGKLRSFVLAVSGYSAVPFEPEAGGTAPLARPRKAPRCSRQIKQRSSVRLYAQAVHQPVEHGPDLLAGVVRFRGAGDVQRRLVGRSEQHVR